MNKLELNSIQGTFIALNSLAHDFLHDFDLRNTSNVNRLRKNQKKFNNILETIMKRSKTQVGGGVEEVSGFIDWQIEYVGAIYGSEGPVELLRVFEYIKDQPKAYEYLFDNKLINDFIHELYFGGPETAAEFRHANISIEKSCKLVIELINDIILSIFGETKFGVEESVYSSPFESVERAIGSQSQDVAFGTEEGAVGIDVPDFLQSPNMIPQQQQEFLDQLASLSLDEQALLPPDKQALLPPYQQALLQQALGQLSYSQYGGISPRTLSKSASTSPLTPPSKSSSSTSPLISPLISTSLPSSFSLKPSPISPPSKTSSLPSVKSETSPNIENGKKYYEKKIIMIISAAEKFKLQAKNEIENKEDKEAYVEFLTNFTNIFLMLTKRFDDIDPFKIVNSIMFKEILFVYLTYAVNRETSNTLNKFLKNSLFSDKKTDISIEEIIKPPKGYTTQKGGGKVEDLTSEIESLESLKQYVSSLQLNAGNIDDIQREYLEVFK